MKKIKVILAMVLTGLGCFNPFAPRLDHGQEYDLVLTEQQTPEQALENFAYAYTFKDSMVYADVLDSSFVFVYFDPTIDNSGRFVSWGRDVDLKTTGQLFANFQTINLVWNNTIYEMTTENSSELSKTLSLNLFGADADYNLLGSAIFNFRKSPYDGRWRITRWKDESHM